MYVYVCMYVCIYIYIYVGRETEIVRLIERYFYIERFFIYRYIRFLKKLIKNLTSFQELFIFEKIIRLG